MQERTAHSGHAALHPVGNGDIATIGNRESKKATFISYTVTGVFPSEEVLQRTCSAIATIDGVMTIF
jgi:hypothetical protein